MNELVTSFLFFRKRGRISDEEVSDFMPLSKRINNLHINNLKNALAESQELLEQNWTNCNFIPPHSELSQGSSSSDGYIVNMHSYMPDLNANENPHYYENNKLLYSLHMERMQRLTGPF